MAGFDTLIFRKVGGVAHISLNRPDVLNAYNMEMRDELFQVLEAARDDPDVRVLVIRGEGRAFCAGADLTEFGTAPSLTIAREVRWERDVWGAFLSIPKLIIAGIHGYCFGSGVEIALLCDIRIASEGTAFAMPEVGLGVIPAAGGTQTLPRFLGGSTTLDLLLTRRRFGSAEAFDIGLVGRVVDRSSLDSDVEDTVRRLLSLDQRSVTAAKEAVSRGADLPLDRALDLEANLALEVMGAWKRP